MNYSSLTATDRGSNKLTGTLVNVNTESSVIGKIGSALRTGATASAQYVSISEAVDDSITSQWSASVWVYRKSASDGTIVRNDEGNGTRGFLIDIFSNNARSYAYVNGVNVATGVTTLSTGKWYHLVGVCDGTTVKIYLNGVQDGSANIGTAGNIGLSSTPLYIGYGNFANSNFDGYIDDVRIYNRALSLGEIKTLYKLGQNKDAVSPTKSLTSDLVGYWTFDGKDINVITGSINDRSGNANTCTDASSSVNNVVQGKLGQAYIFTGSWIDCGSAASLDLLPASNMTMSMWMKPGNLKTGISQLLVKSASSVQTSGWYFAINSSPSDSLEFIVDYNTTDLQVTTNANAVSRNRWQNVVLTYNGSGLASDVHIYIDGVEVTYSTSQNSSGARVSDLAQSLTIGTDGISTNPFYGALDDVRIYNRVLSTREIKQLYTLGTRKIK
jgi:hypothetical protein